MSSSQQEFVQRQVFMQPPQLGLLIIWQLQLFLSTPALASRPGLLVRSQVLSFRDNVTLFDGASESKQTEDGSVIPSMQDIMHGRSSFCGYNKSDLMVLDELNKYDMDERINDLFDSRNGFEQLGFVKGTAQKVLQLARMIGSYRVFPLQLTGRQAVEVIKAQYGIIAVQVPRACFNDMRRDLTLDFEHTTWEEVQQRRKRIRWYLTTGLEKGCTALPTAAAVKRGHAAKTRLEALYWGYWALYETRTSEKHSVIAVRALDEKRFKQGDHSLRQIWHYGKLHIYRYLDQELRQLYVSKNNRMKSENEALLFQRAMVSYLTGLSNARIESVDLDNRGSCISAPANDPEHIMESIEMHSSSLLRTVVFFREQAWEMFFHSIESFVVNPIAFIRKTWNRKLDKWRRSYYGAKLGMVLTPIMKGVAMAGLVLGLATGGAMTLPMYLTAAMAGSGATALITHSATQAESAAVLGYLLDYIFRKPLNHLQSSLQMKLMVWLESKPAIIKLWSMMDEDDVLATIVEDTNLKLQMEVEKILESGIVRIAINKAPEELRPGLQEEARRYAEGMIRASFVEEIYPHVLSAIELQERKKDPSYGWLGWRRWAIYREGDIETAIDGNKIRYEGPDGHWRAKVVGFRSSRKWFSFERESELDIRKLRPDHSDDFVGVKHTMRLTKALKRFLSVYDTDAYKLHMSGWLNWADWEQYYVGYAGSKQLKGKEIYIDEDSPGCQFRSYDHCANALANTFGTTEGVTELTRGAPVVRVSYKSSGIFGTRTIYIDVDGSRSHPCMTKGLHMTRAMRPCLRVKDPAAYKRYLANREHHEQQVRWTNGSVGAESTVAQDVIDAMKLKGGICASCQDKEANAKLVEKYETESASLDVAVEGREEDARTEEEEITDDALAEGLAQFDTRILDAELMDGHEFGTEESHGSRLLVHVWLCGLVISCVA